MGFEILLNIIVGLFGLGIVVFIHELGHYLAAKFFGIKVLAFSVGWGKKIFCFSKGETEYRLSLFPVGGYWGSLESFLAAPSLPDRFFSLDPMGTHLMKKGDYLVGFTRGKYGEMGNLPDDMASYIKGNNITVTGPVYAIYLHDEICTHDSSQYLAQSCVAVSNM